nr:uncharacterized protein LOC113826532 [Penaeus vannamei]
MTTFLKHNGKNHTKDPHVAPNFAQQQQQNINVLPLPLPYPPAEVALADIPAYGFYASIPPLANWTWLQKEIVFPPSTSEATLCINVELHKSHPNNAAILTLNQSFVAGVENDKYKIYNLGFPMVFPRTVSPWQWVLLCYFVGRTTGMAIDGEPLRIEEAEEKLRQMDLTIPYNLTVGIPSTYYDDLSIVQSIGGRVTIPRIFLRRLDKQEMLTLAGCGEVPGEDLGNGVWQVIGGGNVKIGTITSTSNFSEYLVSDTNAANGLVVLRSRRDTGRRPVYSPQRK